MRLPISPLLRQAVATSSQVSPLASTTTKKTQFDLLSIKRLNDLNNGEGKFIYTQYGEANSANALGVIRTDLPKGFDMNKGYIIMKQIGYDEDNVFIVIDTQGIAYNFFDIFTWYTHEDVPVTDDVLKGSFSYNDSKRVAEMLNKYQLATFLANAPTLQNISTIHFNANQNPSIQVDLYKPRSVFTGGRASIKIGSKTYKLYIKKDKTYVPLQSLLKNM
jgi:hypothetical protein